MAYVSLSLSEHFDCSFMAVNAMGRTLLVFTYHDFRFSYSGSPPWNRTR